MIKIVKFEIGHLAELLEISNEVFGQYFLNLAYLNIYLNSDSNKSLVAITPENRVVGFLFLEKFSFVKNSKHFISNKDWFNNWFTPKQNLTLIKQIAVTSAYQSKGVGKLLLNQVNQLNTTLVCVVWDKGEKTPLRYLLSKNNFVQELKIEKYWSNESVEKNYLCDICGQPPCKCNAEIYIKSSALKR